MKRIIISSPNFTHTAMTRIWSLIRDRHYYIFFFLCHFSNHKECSLFCTKWKNTIMHEEKASLPSLTSPPSLFIAVPNKNPSGTKYVLSYPFPYVNGCFCFHWNIHIQHTPTYDLLFIIYHENMSCHRCNFPFLSIHTQPQLHKQF